MGSAIAALLLLPLASAVWLVALKAFGRKLRIADTLRAVSRLPWLGLVVFAVAYLSYYPLSSDAPARRAKDHLGPHVEFAARSAVKAGLSDGAPSSPVKGEEIPLLGCYKAPGASKVDVRRLSRVADVDLHIGITSVNAVAFTGEDGAP